MPEEGSVTLEQQVARYARRLDANDPEWFRKIVLTRFNMKVGDCNPNARYPCGCIGAQLDWHYQKTKPRHKRLWPDWLRGLRRVGIWSTRAFAGADYQKLDELWRAEIVKRRRATR